MPYLGLLSLAHLTLLVVSYRATARRLFTARLPRLLAGFVLAWANLVLTAVALSPLRRLGSPPLYFAVSVLLAVLTHRFLVRACPTPTVTAEPSPRDAIRQIRGDTFSLALAAILIAIVVGVVLVAVAVLPNNWDTLAYRFPRAHFYLSSGALTHAASGIDPRITYYPYNGTLLYLFLAQYQWPAMAWNIPGLGAWLLCGAGAAQLALSMRVSARAAVFTMYTVLATPIVLCLANSTNDELLAAAPWTAALAFAVLAYRHRSPQALVLALLAAAIGVGVKLHWLWLAPWLAVGAVLCLRRDGGAFMRWLRAAVSPPAAAVVALAAATLAGSFLVGNAVASGRLQVTEPGFTARIVNRPFHAGAAVQTTGLYTLQMLVTPFVDLIRAGGVELGSAAYERLNEVSMQWLSPLVRQGPPYTHEDYRFRGLVEPNAALFFEQNLWLGFMPHVALAAWVALIWRRPAGSALPIFLLGALPFWHVTHAAIVRYAETTGTYYAFVAPICAAPAGWLWERARRSRRAGARALSLALTLLVGSHAVFAATLLLSNQRRNVLQAFEPGSGETATTRVSPLVREMVAEARRVDIPYTHWELLYWVVMRLNPQALFVTGSGDAEADLTLFVLSRRLHDNYALHLLPVRADAEGAVRFAGTLDAGNDAVFCSGPTCEAVCRTCDRYLLVPMRTEVEEGRPVLRVGGGARHPDLDLRDAAVALKIDYRVAWRERSTGWLTVAEIASRPLTLPKPLGRSAELRARSRGPDPHPIWQTDFRIESEQLVFTAP